MGTISSSTGLISGLDIEDIVTKLMAIERVPLTQLQTRLKTVEAERNAYNTLSASVLAMKVALTPLKNNSFFQTNKTTSSDTSVLQATATTKATAGTYRIRVKQVATTQQLVSRGVSDPDRSSLGSGTIVVASAKAKLSQATSLDFLNSQQGVSRGIISITDGSGATAKVDLTNASTVEDVLSAINTASGINVRAQVQGDRLAIVDLTGQSASALTVADVSGGKMARDLGIAGSSATGQITGADVNRIGQDTLLSLVNDGNGVGVNGLKDDMRITAASGQSFTVNLSDTMTTATDLTMLNSGKGVRLGTVKVTHADNTTTTVDLSGAKTIEDVITSFKSAGLTVTANGSRLAITDSIKGTGKLVIEDVSGYAAKDLGIAGTSSGGGATTTQTIKGKDVYQIRTVGDVLRAINNANGNNGAVTASLGADGKSITLTDNTSGTGSLAVESLAGSAAAADLGLLKAGTNGTIEGNRLIATLNGTLLRSLNGGKGLGELGQVRITDRAGNESVFDLSRAQTLDDVLSILGSQPAGAQVQVRLSDSGLGLVLSDASGGTGNLKIEDITGTAAQGLKIAGASAEDTLRGGALYRQHVSGSTLLKDLNGGKGVATGSIRITDSAGHTGIIDLTVTDTTRLQDVISKFNSTSDTLQLEARINDTGDGIVIVDKAGGSGQLRIEEEGSTTASDLGIAGTAKKGEDRIDGRTSVEIALNSGDSLNDLVGQLNGKKNLLQASVINDGSSVTPYRLVVSAANTGSRGALAIDAGGSSLDFSTLVQAQDAIVYLGGDTASGGVPIVSSDNQLENAIAGTTLTLTSASDTPVTITISQDTEGLTEQINTFVEKYNNVMSQIKELTAYNSETNERGLLMGDSTVEQIRSSLYSMLQVKVTVGTKKYTLSELGLSYSSESMLAFDTDTFGKAFSSNSDGVRSAFTTTKTGLFAQLDDMLTRLTDKTTGLLAMHDGSLQDRQDLFNDRIDAMTALLDGKEEQLYAQFQAMESALAKLQTQQSSLTTLSQMVSSMKSSSSSK